MAASPLLFAAGVAVLALLASEPQPYCDTGAKAKSDSCTPCPLHAVCRNNKVTCDVGYALVKKKKKGKEKLQCILRPEVQKAVVHVQRDLASLLQRRRGCFECGQVGDPWLSHSDLSLRLRPTAASLLQQTALRRLAVEQAIHRARAGYVHGVHCERVPEGGAQCAASHAEYSLWCWLRVTVRPSAVTIIVCLFLLSTLVAFFYTHPTVRKGALAIGRRLSPARQKHRPRKKRKPTPCIPPGSTLTEALPEHAHWSSGGTVPGRYDIPLNSAEASTVVRKFRSTIGLAGSVTVRKVERVENLDLLLDFIRARDRMLNKYDVDELNIQDLYHGTTAKAVPAIVAEGFDTRLSGTRVGHIWGSGTYFSPRAATSHNYTAPTGSSNERVMFAARVLVGKAVRGQKGMRRPVDANGALVESAVDDLAQPNVVVTFSNGQAYPTYVITYVT